MPDKILIFIPMYNCSPQIPRVLAQLGDPAVARLFHGVVCIDNQSKDDTLAVAQNAMETVPLPHRAVLRNDDNYGLGGSHKVAIAYALQHGYTHLVVLHGDDQGSIGDLVPHVTANRHNAQDCLLGGRFMPGSSLPGYSALRTAANVGFNLLFSAVAGHLVYDLGAGLNMYRVGAFEDGFHLKFADDLTFNCYLLLGGYQKRLRQAFFPLTWREDDQISNAKLFRQGLRTLRLVAHRLFRPGDFLKAEHRKVARSSYPSTVVRAWG